MTDLKEKDDRIYSVSRSGASLKITLPKSYCVRHGIEPGHKLAIRDMGGDVLVLGGIDDVYRLGGIKMDFGKGAKGDNEEGAYDLDGMKINYGRGGKHDS